jgi:hypothetical protein
LLLNGNTPSFENEQPQNGSSHEKSKGCRVGFHNKLPMTHSKNSVSLKMYAEYINSKRPANLSGWPLYVHANGKILYGIHIMNGLYNMNNVIHNI